MTRRAVNDGNGSSPAMPARRSYRLDCRMQKTGPRQVLKLVATAAALAALLGAGTLAWGVAQSAELARQSEALQQRPSNPVLRLLVVGDSTGVGTGASSPQASLVGLIARDHPRLWIDNRARDGARFADVAGQLAGDERFDIVLVLAGGNDVIRLTDAATLREAVDRVATLARRHADHVVLIPPGNVGNAPLFFAPLSGWMTRRSRSLHSTVRDAAARHGAVYVNLYAAREVDPFVLQPGLNAADGLHPSDAGYRLWYAQLRQQAGLDKLLASARDG